MRAICLAFLMLTSHSVLAEEVIVRMNGLIGRGFTLEAGNDCLIVTAGHVVAQEGSKKPGRRVTVEGGLGREVNAEPIRIHPDADLALLKVTDLDAIRCGDEKFTLLPDGLQVVARQESGLVKFIDARLQGENPPRVFLETTNGDQITEGFSGSSVYMNGERAGLLFGRNGGRIEAYGIDYVFSVLEIGTLRPMDLQEALGTLDRANQQRNGSLQGQHVAISNLINRGYTFNGTDFSGVNLSGAVLANGNFSNSKMHFTELANVNASAVNISDSGLRFANIGGSNLAGANLSGTYAPFLRGRNANLSNARLQNANLTFADFRNADLSGADLQGTTLAFADLRGADLRGADLSRAYLIGTMLTEAQLNEAVLADTNMLAAALDPTSLTREQREGACRHSFRSRSDFGISLTERWPSDKYDTGYLFDNLTEGMNFGGAAGLDDKSLPLCKSETDAAVGFDADFPTSARMHLDRYYLSKSGRRSEVIKIVKDAVRRLAKTQAQGPLFRLEAEHVDGWASFMMQNAEHPKPLGTPHATSAHLHLLLMASGLVPSSEKNLRTAFKQRFSLERSIEFRQGDNGSADEKISRYSSWPRFFPERVSLDDLPEIGFGAFSKWTLARIKNIGDRITVPVPGCFRTSDDKVEQTYFSTKTGYLARTVDGGRFPNQVSWPSHSLAKKVAQLAGGRERIVGAPARQLFGLRPVLFVFPQAYDDYEMPVEPDIVNYFKECITDTELELRIERILLEPNSNNVVLIFVEPQEFRIYKEGSIVISGTLN